MRIKFVTLIFSVSLLVISLVLSGCSVDKGLCSDGIHKIGESWPSGDGCNDCSCRGCTDMHCSDNKIIFPSSITLDEDQSIELGIKNLNKGSIFYSFEFKILKGTDNGLGVDITKFSPSITPTNFISDTLLESNLVRSHPITINKGTALKNMIFVAKVTVNLENGVVYDERTFFIRVE